MKRETCLALAVVLLAVCLRLPDLFVPYYNIDELTNSLFAHFFLDGRMGVDDFLGNTYLLTHYFYIAVIAFFGRGDMTPFYAVNLVWTAATTLVFMKAGSELTGKREGGLLAGLFYAVSSVGFLAKDFRAILSESLALLPLGAAAFFYFRALNREKSFFLFPCGLAIGMAALFKAPLGVMIFALWSSLFFKRGRQLPFFIWSALGLLAALFAPILFASSPSEGFARMIGKVEDTQKHYIAFYNNLPMIYWLFKYFVRTLFVVLSAPLIWYFAVQTLRNGIGGRRHSVLFLFVWLVANWFVVSIGKRVFYHYFIFLIPPAVLMAVPAAERALQKIRGLKKPMKRVVLGALLAATVVPPVVYSFDSILDWSTRRKDFSNVTAAIRAQTKEGDKIYVWGIVPQLYYESGRDPATTYFWADTLAGTSPGSPAMEYLQATKNHLTLPEMAIKDLHPSPVESNNAPPLTVRDATGLTDNELLSAKETLDSIANPFWKKVFADFAVTKPVLFIDSSPTGIRGFGHFPIAKYDLLKRFVEKNYSFENRVNGFDFYRLKH